MNAIFAYWKKGLVLLLAIFLLDWLIRRFGSAYIVPLNIGSLNLNLLLTIPVIVSLLVYPIIVGLIVNQVDNKVK